MLARLRALALAIPALLVTCGALAAAPAPPQTRAAVVQAISDCRKITDDASRLACYDQTAGALDQAETKGQVVVIDQDQVKTVRRQAFGLAMPSLSLVFRASPKTGDGVDQLTLVLASAHKDRAEKWVFVSSEGPVWRQTDDFDFPDDPAKGAKLLVKGGILGSFFCKIDAMPQVRCQRVS